ncbi:MAG TPA: DUF1801 domain-containing protein [Verrucomicrobiae bacterium]|nr:DUF1801 domain-containing protein [Verrucomicrobiae bacterium]
MGTIKTVVSDASVERFIQTVEDEKKRADGTTLLEVFARITGESPKIWGTSIIGYGQYHYKSEKSRQEGDWFLTGFSPRKDKLTLYIMSGFENYTDLLGKLGKHKTSQGGCLYINKLADIDMDVLETLIATSFEDMKKLHPAT